MAFVGTAKLQMVFVCVSDQPHNFQSGLRTRTNFVKEISKLFGADAASDTTSTSKILPNDQDEDYL